MTERPIQLRQPRDAVERHHADAGQPHGVLRGWFNDVGQITAVNLSLGEP